MAREKKTQAKKDAQRDMRRENAFQTPSCRHTNTTSAGPIDNGQGKMVTRVSCSDCGKHLRDY